MTTDATRAPHIDAERLAAWADHGLPADEAAAVERHLSECARCQEVLAAFARSAPAPAEVASAEVVPLLARRPVRWVVVGLAAAAVLVITVWNQRRPDAPVADSTVAVDLSRTPPAPPPVAPSSAPPVAAPAPSPVPQLPEPSRPRVKPAAGRRVVAELPAAQTPPPPPAIVAPSAVMPPPPPPQPVLAPPPPQPQPPPAAGAPGRPLGGVATQAPAVTLPIPSPVLQSRAASDAFGAEVVRTIEVAPPVADLQAVALAPARAAGRAGGGAGRGGGVAGGSVRPQTPIRWRIVAGTRVERTVDNGVTWTPVVIDPPLTTALTIGTATSPTVCWLAGRDGVVLVTADGVTFRRVSLPEVVQVIGVTAQDALRALATAAGGRVFETTDGGATWRIRVPG